jgi:hypothetical protein
MKLRNILFAAGAALALSVAGASAQNHHGGGGNHGGGGHSGGGHASHNSGASFHGSARSFNGGGSFRNSGRSFGGRGFSHGGGGRGFIERGRVVDVFRSRHIRYIGEPYFYDGYYVARCYGPYGRLEYCRVDPYSGAFVGFSVRL